jgi:hypothetical protein
MSVSLFLIFVPSLVSATTWLIKSDGTGDAATIQAGIDSAGDGDIVLLAEGTFTGTGNRDVSLQGKSVTVISQGAASSTIIDCQGLGRAFILENGEGPLTTISDLTIENGAASGGGAILCSSSGPTIRDNIFARNTSSGNGGAILL